MNANDQRDLLQPQPPSNEIRGALIFVGAILVVSHSIASLIGFAIGMTVGA